MWSSRLQRGSAEQPPLGVEVQGATVLPIAYRAYGLGRGSVWKVWGPKVWWAYLRLIRRGRRFQRPTEDTLQLGGDFVVGRDGRLVYAFRSADAADRPSVGDLTAAVRHRT